MFKEDVSRAKKIAFVLTLFFSVIISYAKFTGLFPPPDLNDESKYGPPGWFTGFDLGPPPVDGPRDISV